MKLTALFLALSISSIACDQGPLSADPPGAGTPDALGDCTQWGRVSTCPDGTPGCDRMVCLSYDPTICTIPLSAGGCPAK